MAAPATWDLVVNRVVWAGAGKDRIAKRGKTGGVCRVFTLWRGRLAFFNVSLAAPGCTTRWRVGPATVLALGPLGGASATARGPSHSLLLQATALDFVSYNTG